MAVHASYLYIEAPVEKLRTSMAYSPYGAGAVRYAGIASDSYIPFDELPSSLIIGITATEDRMFFSHKGVNPYGILYALKHYYNHRKKLYGASTLTQQLVKNVFLTPERNWWRKYVEMIYAFKMERNFTKQEIFSLYVSIVQMAPNLYGMNQGAQFYFHKTLKDITEAEAMFLVALISAPERYYAMLKEGNLTPMQRQMSMVLFKYWNTQFYLRQLGKIPDTEFISPVQAALLLQRFAPMQFGLTEPPPEINDISPMQQKRFWRSASAESWTLVSSIPRNLASPTTAP